MKRVYQFNELNPERFKDRVEMNSSASFLTMISIIQGVAFYVLIGNTFQDLNDKSDPLPMPFLIYPVLSFTCIVVVYFLYSWFISITFRAPNFHETLIPFVLGAAEVIPMEYFKQPALWWGWFVGFLVVSILAILNTVAGFQKVSFGEGFEDAYRKSKREEYRNIWICVVVTGVAIFAWRTYPSGALHFGWHDWLPASLTLALTTALVLKTQFSYLRPLYYLYGLLRDQPNR